MQLEALRLREVGPFSNGVVVDGMAPGLNLLAAPNERGKSTLFQALRVLFTETYTAGNKTVRSLRPHAGGAPLIACEFRLDDTRWALTKQYLAGRRAELREIDGRRIYRGADVETALADILAAANVATGASGVLWVAQGAGFAQPEVDQHTRTSITRLVQHEAEAASGGAQLAAIHDLVLRDLEALVTRKSRRAKAGSRYFEAQQFAAEIDKALTEAEQREAASRERVGRLAEIRRQLAKLQDPDTRDARRKRVSELADQQSEIARARARIDVFDAQLAGLKADDRAAAERLQQFDDAIAAERRLRASLKQAAAALGSAQAALPLSEARLDEARQRNAALKEQRERMQAARTAAERAARRQEVANRVRGLRRRLVDAKRVQVDITHSDKQLEALKIDEDGLREIQGLNSALAALTARLEAAAPRIEVCYEAGRSGVFLRDGAAVPDGHEIVVERETILTVPGTGEIHIRPGRAEDGSDPVAERNRVASELSAALARCSANSPEAAEAAMDEKRTLLAKRESAAVRLATLAPDGVAALSAEISKVEQELSKLGDEIDVIGDGLQAAFDEAAWTEVNTALAKCDRDLESIRETVTEQTTLVSKLTAECRGVEIRLGELEARLPGDAAGRNAHRDELRVAAQDTAGRLNDVLRQRAAWHEKVPDEKTAAGLGAELEQLRQAEQTEAASIMRLREEARMLEGALARDFEDGVAGQAALLREQADAARDRLRDIELDVAALELLARELGTARQRRSAEVTQPLVRRISHLAQQVLPAAEFTVGDSLAVTQVARDGAAEEIAVLSAGTCEQISVLSRLALADVLAEGGQTLPVLLDDPLVFCDDERLGAMFELLAEAAERRQIIVLSCHARSFAPLVSACGAAPLEFAAWDGTA